MKEKYGVNVSVAPLSGNGAVVNCRAPSKDQAVAASKVISKVSEGVGSVVGDLKELWYADSCWVPCGTH